MKTDEGYKGNFTIHIISDVLSIIPAHDFVSSIYSLIFAEGLITNNFMEKINIITNAISSAITFLENEIQCVEDECLAEEYQAVIDELTNALRTAQEMANP